MRKYRIQTHLAEADLHKIGMYIQTCAHIEHILWLVAYTGFPCEPDEEQGKNWVMKLRNNTAELIKALRTLALSIEVEHQEFLEAILEKVEVGLDTRHGIVHGALSFDRSTGGYMMHRHTNRNHGTKLKPEWVSHEEAFPTEFLDIALTNAESILFESHTLLERLQEI